MRRSESRRAEVVRAIVHGNGDDSAFVSHDGWLLRGNGEVPAILVATERAVHVIDTRTRDAAVCSYHRLLRFDCRDQRTDVLVGLSCYMGSTPTAARVALGRELTPSEVSNYRLRLPRGGDWAPVRERIVTGMGHGSIPAELHRVAALV